MFQFYTSEKLQKTVLIAFWGFQSVKNCNIGWNVFSNTNKELFSKYIYTALSSPQTPTIAHSTLEIRGWFFSASINKFAKQYGYIFSASVWQRRRHAKAQFWINTSFLDFTTQIVGFCLQRLYFYAVAMHVSFCSSSMASLAMMHVQGLTKQLQNRALRLVTS